MKVKTMSHIFLLLSLSALLLSACNNYPSLVDDKFSSALRENLQMQTANSDAAIYAQQPAKSDGQSAKAAIDRYQKSFEVLPLPTNVFNIGVGSGTTGGVGPSR
jgi:starvation-inducible outer membrane lipoprotein